MSAGHTPDGYVFHTSELSAGPYSPKEMDSLDLYDKIAMSNELGLSPYVLNVYQVIVKPLLNPKIGVPRRKIQERYYSIHKKYLPTQVLQKEILPALELAGLIVEEPDEIDKRRMLIWPPDQTTITPERGKGSDNENNDSLDRGLTTKTGPCIVCGTPCSDVFVRDQRVMYLHSSCSERWGASF